jgi:hypothetical protein
MKLNIGCGPRHHAGYLNIDSREPAQLVFDLDHLTGSGRSLPIEDDVVTEIVATDFFEHIHDRLGLMQELYRVARNGCVLKIRVPASGHDDSIDDPTHVAFYGPRSFRFFAQPWWHNNDYGYTGDWQEKTVVMGCHIRHKTIREMKSHGSFYEYVQAHRNVCYALFVELAAVKPGRDRDSGLIVHPTIAFDFA